ncbi:D-alanyl-D-alanine dipeptidase [Modicisalibacter ilicicola DSM 19980]|uniref:D-alanyl-D-alanine dipeptidase n=1 Tax=Modicisalibacter ilicicola DSM 19980 TaxID=1121942 RepID=A0A1M4WBI8_9GAMM|nr:M15 family metallopeptidase [Halomonas ilicicola]SHE78332.1 D-alanyl-D-alanine dipeptidase [Halomonas ilicicola DSM 19980]
MSENMPTPDVGAMEWPPIPSRDEPAWATLSGIPILADAAPLVPVSLAPEPLKTFPVYARQGIPGAVAECYVREEVYRRLLAAARSLPEGLGLVVLDGWRPWRVQQYLFETLYEAIRVHHPEADEAELVARTREFVAVPSTDPQAPSPHLTGGAVDVTLCDADGLLLDMGSLFDEAIPASHSDHLERQDDLDERQRLARDRRRLLHHVMQAQGFTNLPSEWWHFDFGDQLWALYGGHDRALYGPSEPESIENRWRRQL